MTAARLGDAFHVDLDGTVITGRYIEVDPPRRLVIELDPQGSDTATTTPAFVEITLTPTGDGTNVNVQLYGLSPEDETVNLHLWTRHLDQIATALTGGEPTHEN